MSQAPVSQHVHAGVCTITVERPEKLNALDAATLQALADAFQTAAVDPAVRAVVLTGSGDRAFVAGADIAAMQAMDPMQARTFSQLGQDLMRRIERMSKPVIARINGYALGGGLELAMACHLRIAATTARLGQPEISLGLLPGFGGSQRLLRLAGRGAALELCLLGAPIDAARALQLGIVTEVVDKDQLDARVDALATQLAGAAPLALRAVLDAIHIGGESALEEGLQYETAQFALLFATEDMREGTTAFLQRRPPAFSGH